jgi:hypothetical protein
MWAGQTDRGITVRDARLEIIGQLIGEKLGHVGILDCDVFVTNHGAIRRSMSMAGPALISAAKRQA